MKKFWSLLLVLLLTSLSYAYITPLPDPPSRTNPSTFATKADAFLGALPAFATEANQLASDVNDDEVAAAASAAAALGYSNIALSSANFAGDWDDQAGAAAPPYAVWHAGNYWQLVSAVLDVSATEPGQTADWRVIGDKLTVSTIADLRLISGVGISSAYLIGYSSPEDGGDGVFYWDADSVLSDNGGTIIAVTGVATGRWIRQYSGPVNVMWFGGGTAGFQAAINYVESLYNTSEINWAFLRTLQVYVPSGLHSVSGLVISSPMKIVGDSRDSTIIKSSSTSAPVFTVRGKLISDSPTLIESQEVMFENLTILGSEGSGQDKGFVNVNEIGIKLISSDPLRQVPQMGVYGCSIKFMGSHGIYADTTTSLNIYHNEITFCSGDAIYLTGKYNTDFRIYFNKLRRSRTGINFAPNAGYYITTGNVADNLIESNRTGLGTAGSATRPCMGIRLLRVQNCKIERNYFERHLNSIYAESNVSFNTIASNYFDGSDTSVPNYTGYAPLERQVAPIYFDGTDNFSNRILNNRLYHIKRPITVSEANWGTATWGDEYEHLPALNGCAYTEIQGNLARDDVAGQLEEITYASSDDIVHYRGTHRTGSYLEQKEVVAENIRKSSISMHDYVHKYRHESESTSTTDPAREVYIHPYTLTDEFKRFFTSAQRNSDGTLSAEVDAFGINGQGELAIPVGKYLAFQSAAGDYFQRHGVGLAAPSSGTWSVGNIIWNRSPNSGEFIGWTCTVAGTPGTWKGFGLIE